MTLILPWGSGPPDDTTGEPVRAFREHSSPEPVELCARYSNRDDMLEPLVSVLEQINTGTSADSTEDQLVSADGATPTAWRVADRLSDADIANLIAAYQAGNTVRDVAERFNLGTTTVKRLLRKHRARRKDR